jgi:RHS repeat-associated protein
VEGPLRGAVQAAPGQAAQQASGLAGALDRAAKDVEALKKAALEEQERREQAREWQRENAEDQADWYDPLQFWEDDRPPVGPPKDPPIRHAPAVKTLGAPFEGPAPRTTVSSAAPADLEAYVRGSRRADDALRKHERKLPGLHREFVDGLGWGKFDAESLIVAFSKYLKLNGEEARRIATIAKDFRRAGGEGPIKTLPDAAIEASLRAKGLAGGRSAITFNTAAAYGFPPTTGYANDPVNTASGNFVEAETDLRFAGLLSGLEFTRTYNSRSDRAGPFGRGWSSWATARLRARPQGAEYEGPDGQRADFPRQGAGYGRVLGVGALVEPLESGLALDWFGGGRWEFDDAGLPVRASRGPGTEVRFAHDEDGRLAEIAHANGKRVALEWEGERIAALACSDGRRVEYAYDDGGNLVEADSSTAGPRRYGLDAAGRIVTVTDADGVEEVANSYDDDGLVTEQVSSFGRRTTFAYLPGLVTVTSDEQDGPANTYVHDAEGRLRALVDGNGERFAVSYDEWGNPVSVTERNGAVTVQEWDERVRLTRRTLPGGASYTFRHDDADRVVEAAMSTGEVTRLRYDGDERSPAEVIDPEGGVTRMTVVDGLVREIVDPDGVRVRFEFDADGNIVGAIDADGNVARLERDPGGLVTAAVTPNGRRTTFAYDARRRPLERRDPAGAIWRYEHTEAGRLAALVDPTGAREEFTYGEHGALAAAADALGNVTTRSYDVFGNLAGIAAPDGATWSFGYDALCRPTSTEDPSGATWRREYDVNGNVCAAVDPLGTRATATLDLAGRVSALDDGLTSSAFDFDALGRCISQRRPDGSGAKAAYDRCGRRIAVEDPMGGVTRFEYTPAGRLRRAVAPSGRTEEFEYDHCGRLAARVDGARRRWRFRYDADGNVVEQVAPDGALSRFRYDEAGRVVELQAPGRGRTTYAYDAAGRVVEISDRVAGTRRFAYDAAGRLAAATDANGGVTRYGYDARGRLTEVADPMGGRVTREYDAAGRLGAETDPLGRTTKLSYDAAGRLTERVDGSGRRMRWSYDESGRVRAYGAAGEEPITIRRDELGRPLGIDEPGAPSNRLRWDRAGRLVERRRGELALQWRYDEDGRRAALAYPDGSETRCSYDDGGRLSALEHPATGPIDLRRDPAGRLVGASADGMHARWEYAAGELTEYEIDAGGRSRSARLTRDDLGRVTAAELDGTAIAYTYDAAGQLASAGSRRFSYDANGRLTHDGETAYEYDDAGQLRLLVRSSGETTRFTYDGAGRRVCEETDGVTRTFTWDALGRLSGVEERTVAVDALGELAAVDGTPLMWDTADPMGPLSWLGDAAVVGHGAPWALAGADGAEWLAPDWQGTVAGASSAGPRLGQRGEVELDGLTWLRSRVYDAATYAFLSRDPLPGVPGTPWSANPYHYAGNNPVGLADPLGLRPVTDQELAAYRDQMANPLQKATEWVGDNWEYIAAGAMVVGGIALMATGFGGPVGAAMIGGALLSAGASTGIQKATTGDVDWGQVVVDGAIGGLAGGAGVGAGALLSGGSKLAAFGRGALAGGVESVAGGAANRGLRGENVFDPAGMGQDLLLGGVTGGVGGRLGDEAAASPPPYKVGPLPKGVLGETDDAGNITIARGVSGSDLDETLRHEAVHRLVTPKHGPFVEARRTFRGALYEHSHLARYTEEALAETHATRSIREGLAFPVQQDYVSVGGVAREAAGVGGAAVGAAAVGGDSGHDG